MAFIPTRRLLVYIVSGLVVLAVGTGAVVSMNGSGAAESGLVISSGAEAGQVESTRALMGLGGDAASPAGATSSTTSEPATMYVQVVGAVERPGVYEMPLESRVFQAVQKAGGFSRDADQQAVSLAARLSDGCRVYVPRVGETAPASSGSSTDPALIEPGAIGSAVGDAPVSINSAVVEELDALPGIGPAIAQDIVAYREANGPFTSVDQLTDVPGIGPSKLEQIRPLVTL
jgi:competence protein ComEA